MNPIMNARFPRVTLPGITDNLEPWQRDIVDRATAQKAIDKAQAEAWRNLKVAAAMALLRTGQIPYVRPSKAERLKRRATGKRQRLARKDHR